MGEVLCSRSTLLSGKNPTFLYRNSCYWLLSWFRYSRDTRPSVIIPSWSAWHWVFWFLFLDILSINWKVEVDHVGLWTLQDDKELKLNSPAPLNPPLPKLYVCIDNEQWHQNSEQVAFLLFSLPLTAGRSNSQRVMLCEYSPTDFNSRIYVSVYSVYGPFRLFIHGQMHPNKNKQNHRGLLSMKVFCGGFCIPALPFLFYFHWN